MKRTSVLDGNIKPSIQLINHKSFWQVLDKQSLPTLITLRGTSNSGQPDVETMKKKMILQDCQENNYLFLK